MANPREDLQRLVEHAVQRLADDWSSRAWTHRPLGMWVLLWSPIDNDEELNEPFPKVPLLGAWLLTSSGYVRHDVWRYLRLRAMQWANRAPTPPTSVGVLEVAPYRSGTAVYAAGWYGPLNAYGVRMELDSQGQPVEHRFWVS